MAALSSTSPVSVSSGFFQCNFIPFFGGSSKKLYFPMPKDQANRLGGGIDLDAGIRTRLVSRSNRLGVDLLSSRQWKALESLKPERDYQELDDSLTQDIREYGRIIKSERVQALVFMRQALSTHLSAYEYFCPESPHKLRKKIHEVEQDLIEVAQREQISRLQFQQNSAIQAVSFLEIDLKNRKEQGLKLKNDLDAVCQRLSEIAHEPRNSGLEMHVVIEMSDATRREHLDQQEYNLVKEYEILCTRRRGLEESYSCYRSQTHTRSAGSAIIEASNRLEKAQTYLRRIKNELAQYKKSSQDAVLKGSEFCDSLIKELRASHQNLSLRLSINEKRESLERNIAFIQTQLLYHRDT